MLCLSRISHLRHLNWHAKLQGFPGGSDGKDSTCNAGDLSLIPGSGRFPGEGDGYPLQYSYLENSTDRGAWWTIVPSNFHWMFKLLCRCESESCSVMSTLYDPMDCSPPDSSVHMIFQARILEWIAMPYSGGSSQPRFRTCVSYVSCIAGRFFTHFTLEAH